MTRASLLNDEESIPHVPSTVEWSVFNHAIGFCRKIYNGHEEKQVMKQFDRLMLAYEDYEQERLRTRRKRT